MDGLSGAASVAGIVSLTVQLAESIQKLCKFLSSFKHASEDIEDIIDDLEVLTCVLAEIQHCEELFGPQRATEKALLRCRRQVLALCNMVCELKEDLGKESRWRRGQAAFKTVIKADKVKEWRGKINETKETLSLALQASSSRVQYTQLIAIAKVDGQMAALNGRTSHIQALVETSSVDSSYCSALAQPATTLASNVSPLPTSYCSASESTSAFSQKIRSRRAQFYYDDEFSNSWTHNLLGTVKYRSRRRRGAASEDENELVDVLFQPSWWLQKLGFKTLFGAQLERSFWFGWRLSLRTEHLMSPELSSHVENVIQNGRLQDLIDMLSSGMVSIHSTNVYGDSLLQRAAFKAQPEICAFLLKAGADPQARHHNSRAAFHGISFHTPISTLDELETMKVFIAAGQDFLDIELSDTLRIFQNYFMGTSEDAMALCWLLDQLIPTLELCDELTLAESWAAILGAWGPVGFLRHAFALVDNPRYKRLGLVRRLDHYIAKEEAEIWLNELGSLHFAERTEPSGRACSLSLHSMATPSRLSNLRCFLHHIEIPVEEFVKGEIPLANEAYTDRQNPWTEENLLDLFHWDFEGIFALDREDCSVCQRFMGWELVGEDNAVWILGVQQIKCGSSPDGPFEGEEEKGYRRWTRYMERWRSERICKDCQDEEGMTGDGNFESSPFLLDI